MSKKHFDINIILQSILKKSEIITTGSKLISITCEDKISSKGLDGKLK